MTSAPRPRRRAMPASGRLLARCVVATAAAMLVATTAAVGAVATAPPATTTTATATSTAATAATVAPGADGRSGSRATQRLRWPDDAGDDRVGRVTVSKTENLATREIVTVSWSGFLPTTNADGPESTHQAPQAPLRSGYPVVLLECQGDDPATMTPEDCPIPNPSRFYYYATKDALETEEVQAASSYDSRAFVDANGKRHTAPGPYQNVPMPSDYSDENVSGTNWYATWTETDGTRSEAKFEVRSTKEAPESLGCGDPTTRLGGACSIVVVPIRPLECVDDTSCLPPSRTRGFSADYHQWQSASNWRNKFVFPVTFKPFPDVCELDSRSPVPTAGSELLDQAMLSWVPEFCGSKDLFKLSFTRTNDESARRALVTGAGGLYQSNLAFTTRPVASTQDRPIVNAPVAVTGFVVALALDSTGYEEISDVRLNPRLLAKLVTQSYYAPPVPYLRRNPSDLLHDPEFRALNPGVARAVDPSVQIDNPVVVQGSPDLVWEVTRYIASDPAAAAWLGGKPDPWGMRVNPNFAGDKWPVPNANFQLRDDWEQRHATSTSPCDPKPVLEQESQFVYNLLAATLALVDRQPQNYGVCKASGQGGDVWAWSRPDRQPLGQRSMIAITDYAHAAQYQLPSAALRNAAGRYVTPSRRSLAAALRAATVDPDTRTVLANFDSRRADAYPGVMVVNAAAPTDGLGKEVAADYATMLRWMAGPGQVYGDAAGQLPAGYLALTPAMRQQTRAAAGHVEAQDGFGALPPPNKPNPPTTRPDGADKPDPSNDAADPPPATPPAAEDPPKPQPAPEPSAAPPVVDDEILTQAQSSELSRNLLPLLLVIGVAGLILAPLMLVGTRVVQHGGARATARDLVARLRRGGGPS